VELNLILQVLSILAAGGGAALFVDNRITNRFDKLDKRIDTKFDAIPKDYIPRAETERVFYNHEKRIEGLESKIGDIAQKAQILVAERDLKNFAAATGANGSD
jgi:hypothetical protein